MRREEERKIRRTRRTERTMILPASTPLKREVSV
jgi:ATP-dependent RNA helicase DDX21